MRARRAGMLVVAATLLAAVSVGGSASAVGGAGARDASFGVHGKVITAFGTSNESVRGIAIQSNGRIVAVGEASNGVAEDFDFALARYRTDGTLDGSFGTGGRVTTPIGPSNDGAHAVALQADGKIVAAGSSTDPVTATQAFALARYGSDGALDPSFGTGGTVTTPIGTSLEGATALAIQSDGRIVAGGWSSNGVDDDFTLVRYQADGALDTSFGAGGIARTDFGAADHLLALAIQPDGKIVAAGDTDTGVTSAFALSRYQADGSLDAGFGPGGRVTTPIGDQLAGARAVAIQPNGRIVAGGWAFNGSDDDVALIRYRKTGTLDTTFGTGGKVVTAVGGGDDAANAVAIQDDGRIVAAGSSFAGAQDRFAVLRYDTGGSKDPSFHGDGMATTCPAADCTVYCDSSAFAAAIQANGRIIAAGEASNKADYDFALVRYLG